MQRRIPLPQKFWEEFPVGSFVKVELMKTKNGSLREVPEHA